MPTREEQDELRNNCYWKWVTKYNGKSVNGYIVYKVKDSADKGKESISYSPVGSYSVSDPHLFLSTASYRNGSELYYVGSNGSYWSSSLYSDPSYRVYSLFLSSGNVYSLSYFRFEGLAVRPVCQ